MVEQHLVSDEHLINLSSDYLTPLLPMYDGDDSLGKQENANASNNCLIILAERWLSIIMLIPLRFSFIHYAKRNILLLLTPSHLNSIVLSRKLQGYMDHDYLTMTSVAYYDHAPSTIADHPIIIIVIRLKCRSC
jgi:hypothetical protein